MSISYTSFYSNTYFWVDLIGISQEVYRATARGGSDIEWRCILCAHPNAETSRWRSSPFGMSSTPESAVQESFWKRAHTLTVQQLPKSTLHSVDSLLSRQHCITFDIARYRPKTAPLGATRSIKVMTKAMPLCLYEFFNKVFCYLPAGNWVIQFYRSRSDVCEDQNAFIRIFLLVFFCYEVLRKRLKVCIELTTVCIKSWCFLGAQMRGTQNECCISMLRKLGNICCGHKMFLNKIRNIFCVPDAKFVSSTNVARAGKRRNICVGNNVSATMCPRLPGPLCSRLCKPVTKTELFGNASSNRRNLKASASSFRADGKHRKRSFLTKMAPR